MKFANLFGGVKREAQAAPLTGVMGKYLEYYLTQTSNAQCMQQ